jgi:hypothetical protein
MLNRTGIKDYILQSSNSEKGCKIRVCNLKKHLSDLKLPPKKVVDIVDATRTLVTSGGGSTSDVIYDEKKFGLSPRGVSIIGSFIPKTTYKSLRF